VTAGQVVAVLDDRMLQAGVAYADAARRKAEAGADTLAANASDLRDQRGTLLDARSTLRQQQSLLTGAKDKLATQSAQLVAQLPQMEKAIVGLKAMRKGLRKALADAQAAAKLPTPPPGIAATIAALKVKNAAVDAQLAKLEAGYAQLAAALPKLAAAKAKLAAGEGMMTAAKSKMRTALSKMDDGISQLENASVGMRKLAQGQVAGSDLARYTLGETRLRAPVSGVIVSAMPSGQVAMVGAPVVVIRPDAPVLVDAYLVAEQASRVKVGDTATVTFDSLPRPVEGKVTDVSTSFEFPPNNYPTPIVHLANAVRVTVSVTDRSVPLGVPVDVSIHPSR
jgi:multidrug resistance efflux pump